MNITRHNYEEFFLLYVDNELTQAERAEVETFLQDNPDLRNELDLLKDAVVIPNENFQLPGKEVLYKDEQSINLNNYEEYFLSYVDDELNNETKSNVEQFVLQHPKVQDEFTLLQQTKLQPEVIEFSDKSSLYKQEGRVRRLIPIAFMRVAVAAAVIGVVALLWFNKPIETEQDGSIALIEEINKTPRAQKQQNALEEHVQKQGELVSKEIAVERKRVTKTKAEAIIKDKTKKVATPVDEGNLNNLPSSENNPVLATNKRREVEPDAVVKPVQILPESPSKNNSDFAANSKTTPSATIVQHAVYKEVDEDDDNTILIAGAEINKNKLRGLFKKATTLLEKRLRKNEGHNVVQIAAFEIKTK